MAHFPTMADDHARAELWVDCGPRWFDNADPFILLNMQMLGHAEPPLLALETELALQAHDRDRDIE